MTRIISDNYLLIIYQLLESTCEQGEALASVAVEVQATMYAFDRIMLKCHRFDWFAPPVLKG